MDDFELSIRSAYALKIIFINMPKYLPIQAYSVMLGMYQGYLQFIVYYSLLYNTNHSSMVYVFQANHFKKLLKKAGVYTCPVHTIPSDSVEPLHSIYSSGNIFPFVYMCATGIGLTYSCDVGFCLCVNYLHLNI